MARGGKVGGLSRLSNRVEHRLVDALMGMEGSNKRDNSTAICTNTPKFWPTIEITSWLRATNDALFMLPPDTTINSGFFIGEYFNGGRNAF